MNKILECINHRNIVSVSLNLIISKQLKDYLKRFPGLNTLEWVDSDGNTLIHKCVRSNFIQGVELLVNMGLNIDT